MKNKNGLTLIKKANNLIEARYKFDIWETRFFLSVLAQIHKNDKDFQVYRILYRDIIKMFDLYSGPSYNLLREGASNLMKKVLYVPYVENGVTREKQYHIIHTIDYLTGLNGEKELFLEHQEFIDVTIAPEMKPLLLQLRDQGGFTFYELKNVIKLTVYSLRIYELLKQYQKIGRRKLSVEEIKRTFELETEYPLFGHFYSRVIAPSVKEINKHTDLEVDTPEKIKEGKKVVALLFTFRKKESNVVPEQELSIDFKHEVETAFETISSVGINANATEKIQPDYIPSVGINANETKNTQPDPILNVGIYANETKEQSPDLTESLYTEFETDVVKGFGVTPFVLVKLIENYDAELIRKQIRITKRKRGSSPTTNIAGFFVNAVKTDYNDPEEAREAKKQANLEAKRKAQQAQIEAQQREAKRKERIEERKETVAMLNKSVNNTIRKLVAKDPTVTARAIAYATQRISTDATLRTTFDQLGYQFEQLDLEIWRKESFLCQQVIEAMQKIEPQAFVYLSSLLEELEELEQEIKSLPQLLQRRGATV